MAWRKVWLLMMLVLALARVKPACCATFIAMSDEEMAEAADVVVVGRVERIRSGQTLDGALRSSAVIAVEEALKGNAPARVVIQVAGGTAAPLRRVVAGAPTYTVGERVLVFLRRQAGGDFEPVAMAMGSYRITSDAGDTEMALRDLADDAVVYQPRGSRLARVREARGRPLRQLREAVRRVAGRSGGAALVPTPPSSGGEEWRRVEDEFELLGPPAARWPEPDRADPIAVQIDPAGDAGVGDAESLLAAQRALAAWAHPACSNLQLVDGGDATPAAFSECDGRTQIIFRDPFDEMPPPLRCAGLLAMGGYCAVAEPGTIVGGVGFERIVEGDIVVNHGFAGCSFWTAENLAEVLTHELGHVLGFGHSSENPLEPDERLQGATMFFRPHFDGRGAGLEDDDLEGICSVYPREGSASDVDADDVADTIDNCAESFNPEQYDRDGDGLGDACDPLTVRRLIVAYDARAGDRLHVTGEILPPGRVAFDPSREAITIALTSPEGVVYEIEVPADSWIRSRSGQRWRWRSEHQGPVRRLRLRRDGARTEFSLIAWPVQLERTRSVPVTLIVRLRDTILSNPTPLRHDTIGAGLFP